MAGRRPHYRLGALHKKTEERGNVGAAWINDDGTIAIRLEPFVVLESSVDLVLTLFPEKGD